MTPDRDHLAMPCSERVNTGEFQFRPHARYYWIAWATVLTAFSVVRFVLLPRFSSEPHFDLAGYYMPAVWIPIIALNFFEGRRLMTYLRERHPAKWAELTTIPGFGPGNVNGFRSLPWLFSADTLSDPVVAQLQLDYRRFICWVLTVFFTFPIFTIVLGT